MNKDERNEWIMGWVWSLLIAVVVIMLGVLLALMINEAVVGQLPKSDQETSQVTRR